MAYRNDTKGARPIHLTGGGHVLVEPGETVSIPAHRVLRLGPGIVEAEDPDLGPVPEDLKEAVTAAATPKKPAASIPAAKKRTARKPAKKR